MKTVLLVDDEPDVLDVYAMLLEMSGFSVNTATNGRQALAALGSELPDVIVTDWMMPVMDGRALCEALRGAAGELSHVPIIVASAGMTPPEGGQRLYDVFMRKPFAIDDLVAAINAIVCDGA